MVFKIEKLDHHGRGIAHHNGKIVFVENALEEEEVEAKIVKTTTKYEEAVVTDYLKKSSATKTP